MNAFLSGNARLTRTTPISNERISTDTASGAKAFLEQQGENEFNRHGLQTGLGFDWTYKEKNNFAGSVSYATFGNKGNGFVNQSEIVRDDLGNLLSQINSINRTKNSFKEQSVDFNLEYKRSFEKEDQELEIGLNSSLGPNNRKAGNDQFIQPQDSLIYGTRSNNPGRENESQLMIDYVQPLSSAVRLGFGGKLNFYDINSTSDVLVWQPNSMDYLFDSSLSNDLDYHQKVYALYGELSFPVGKLFDAKVGGRYERTQVNSFFLMLRKTSTMDITVLFLQYFY
jgi:hypothetical protein